VKSFKLEIEVHSNIKKPIDQNHAHLGCDLLIFWNVLSAYLEVLLSQKVKGSLDVGIRTTEFGDCVGFSQKWWQLIAVQLSLVIKELMSKGLLSRDSPPRIEVKQPLEEI
jgi:hypothetical protein